MILVIDDEPNIRSSLSGLLSDDGYEVLTAESAEEGGAILGGRDVDLILLDLQLPGKDGLTFLEENRRHLDEVPVIMISGRGDVPTAVAAIRLGASDFIEKPLNPERVLLTVRRELRLSHSLQMEKKLTGRILEKYEIIGQSRAIRELDRLIEKAAGSDVPVLITGESGTGKELAAHQIHYLSRRKAEPLVVVNLPAVPETLFESELFGHVRGAFSGAGHDRSGRFELAHRGTILLDEIAELPPAMQAKLLRVLESGRFEKIGSEKTVSVDCRLIAATNRDLGRMIEGGSFRPDLYYRLEVLPIAVPPLRERPEDVPLLTDYFLRQLNADNRYAFSAEAAGIMASHPWPGNVRQLKNLVHQLVLLCDPGEIRVEEVEKALGQSETTTFSIPGESRLAAAVRQFETGFLSRLHQKHGGSIAAMARELGMDRGNLSKKLKSLGIV